MLEIVTNENASQEISFGGDGLSKDDLGAMFKRAS